MRRSIWVSVLVTAAILGVGGLAARPLARRAAWGSFAESAHTATALVRPFAVTATARLDGATVPPLAAAALALVLCVSLGIWLRPRRRRLANAMIRRGRPLARVARRTGLPRDALRTLSRGRRR